MNFCVQAEILEPFCNLTSVYYSDIFSSATAG